MGALRRWLKNWRKHGGLGCIPHSRVVEKDGRPVAVVTECWLCGKPMGTQTVEEFKAAFDARHRDTWRGGEES